MDGWEISLELVIALAAVLGTFLAWNQQRIARAKDQAKSIDQKYAEQRATDKAKAEEQKEYAVETARLDERIKRLESETGKERDFRKDVYESMENFGSRLGSIESWIKLRGDPD